MDITHVDCNRCVGRGAGCGDCVISVLLGVPPEAPKTMDLLGEERAALKVLAESGLLPPLRMVQPIDPLPWPSSDSAGPSTSVRLSES